MRQQIATCVDHKFRESIEQATQQVDQITFAARAEIQMNRAVRDQRRTTRTNHIPTPYGPTVQRAQAFAGVGFNGETQRGIVTETNQVLAHARVDRTARGGVQRVVQIE